MLFRSPVAVGADLVFGEYHTVSALAPRAEMELLAADPILIAGAGPGLPEPGVRLGRSTWQSVLLAVATRRGAASFAIGDPAVDVAALAAVRGADSDAVGSAIGWLADLLLSGVGQVSPVPPSALGAEATAGLFRLSSLAGLQDLAVYALPGANAVVAQGFALAAVTPRGSALLPDMLAPEVLEAGLRARRLLPLAPGLGGSRLLQANDAWASGTRLVYAELEARPLVLLDRGGLPPMSELALAAIESGRGTPELHAAIAAQFTPDP